MITLEDYNLDGEDPDKHIFKFGPKKLSGAGILAFVLVGSAAFGIMSFANYTATTQTKKLEYEQLTNKVEVIAQPGDTVSGLMTKYSGFPAEGRALYKWQMDNDLHPTENMSFGKKYVVRTTNTVNNTGQ